MKIMQFALLGVAAAAGIAAFTMSSGTKAPPVQVVAAAPPPQIPTTDVLVATHDIAVGAVISDADMTWQAWPNKSSGADVIIKSPTQNVMDDIKGSIARASFVQGEPLRRGKLVKGPNSGFLAAILPSGYRAVAINIDSQGATTAGGFILPDDRVDVICTQRDEDAAKAGQADAYKSRTILSNIRVLAIGQNVQEKNNERVVVGSNATLEVTPDQAEILVEAQRVGQLSLSLRSIMDAQNQTANPDKDRQITIVRYGVAVTAVKN